MPTQKLYAGAKLRETRTRLGLTQKDFAGKLGVSLPYLNQMENNKRPVSTTVVLNLAQEFGFDVTEDERITVEGGEIPVEGDRAVTVVDDRLTEFLEDGTVTEEGLDDASKAVAAGDLPAGAFEML